MKNITEKNCTPYLFALFQTIRKKPKIGLLLSLILITAIIFYRCLPNALFNSPVSSIILSKEGKLLGAHISKDEQWRFPPSDELPEKFQKSIISFEDKRFQNHFGIDPIAIARAIKLNIKSGRIVSGGSTISMQVIRLASKNPERSLRQKLWEAFRALRLETLFSKNEILKMYANNAPFGGNVVGLEAASWRYFGREPQQLSWSESAMLAVLPNSPALIHPGRKRDKLKNKRDKLLKRLWQQKHISKLDYQLAIAEKLPLKPRPLPRMAPHLLDTLSKQKLQTKRSTSQRFLTTLNHSVQQQSNQIVKHHAELLALKSIHNLSLLVVDNKSFEVVAYVGNAPTKKNKEYGQAIDLIQKPRSTGSTLKPFLFASMIESGELLPETLVADAPIRYTGYRPKNFDRKYRGTVRAKQALASSLNIPAVNMLSQHGVERFLASLQEMGMSTLHRRSREYGLPLVLGGAEGTLWELSNMYANLAYRSQQSTSPTSALRKQLKVLNTEKTTTELPDSFSPATAWMTLNALLEVGRPGNTAYWKRFDSTHKIAWKTGTSFGHRDAWSIGTTPHYTVGVWVGNAAGEGRQGMTGVKIAAPIMFDVFNYLNNSVNDAIDTATPIWFKQPIEQMKSVSICKNDGFLANSFCEKKDYFIPKLSHFDQVSQNHHSIFIDKQLATKQEIVRVHAGCESKSNMKQQSWFVLPPEQAYYYQQNNADYKVLPKWRNDCVQVTTDGKSKSENPISIIYPRRYSQIKIPTDLANKKGKTIFQAIHGDSNAKIFWHLNDEFLGSTQRFHERALWITAGDHKITLVDDKGNRVERSFTVLPK